MGVDLFFVLSGFLITRILLKTKGSERYYKNFISPLPQDLATVLFSTVADVRRCPFSTSIRDPYGIRREVISLVGLSGISTECSGSSSNHGDRPAGSSWSLAVEEQFYLAWPLVVRMCTETQLRRIAIVVIGVSPVLRVFLSLHGVNIYSNTFCRLDGLMAGSMLALFHSSRDSVSSRFVAGAWATLVVSGSVALLLGTLIGRSIQLSFVSLAAVSFVYLALFSRQRWLQAFLANSFLIYTGTISFGIYLLEKIPLDVAKGFHLDKYPLLIFPVTAACTYGLASLSWNFLEKPFLRLKRVFGETELSETGTDKLAVHFGR